MNLFERLHFWWLSLRARRSVRRYERSNMLITDVLYDLEDKLSADLREVVDALTETNDLLHEIVEWQEEQFYALIRLGTPEEERSQQPHRNERAVTHTEVPEYQYADDPYDYAGQD